METDTVTDTDTVNHMIFTAQHAWQVKFLISAH